MQHFRVFFSSMGAKRKKKINRIAADKLPYHKSAPHLHLLLQLQTLNKRETKHRLQHVHKGNRNARAVLNTKRTDSTRHMYHDLDFSNGKCK